LQAPGWQPFENTIEIFEKIGKIKTKDDVTQLNLYLWVYGHIIEASKPYDMIANFLRIIDDNRYSIDIFPDNDRGKYKIPQSPAQKIEKLKELAKRVNLESCLNPINEIFNRELRNGIFHSDYSIYDGGVRIRREYLNLNSDETYRLLNRALAYFESLKYLYNKSIADYNNPIEIDLPEEFHYPKAVAMVRKNYGVIGIKDNWTKEQLAHGLMPFRFGRFKRHELAILQIDPTISYFPEDKIETLWKKYQKIRKWTPKAFRKYLNKWHLKKHQLTQEKLIKSTIANK
jgi:hypothetical protein